MSLLVLISAFLLLLTVAWSLYSEFFGLRPWRDYQNRFRRRLFRLSAEANRQAPQADEQTFYATPDYKKLKAAVDAAAHAALPTDHQIQAQIDLLDRQRAAMTPSFPDRSRQSRRPHLSTGSRFRTATRAPRTPS